jgi:hypothetical protein
MPKTVQIRQIDDDVYAALQRHAAGAGLSVPEFLRREASRVASRPTLEEWLSRTRRRNSAITSEEVTAALDEVRGPWPDAGS